MERAVVTLKKGGGRAMKAGGMWIYDNEIEFVSGDFENGDVVEVCDFDGYGMGCGFINTRSKITVRMLSRKKKQSTTRGLSAHEFGAHGIIAGTPLILPAAV